MPSKSLYSRIAIAAMAMVGPAGVAVAQTPQDPNTILACGWSSSAGIPYQSGSSVFAAFRTCAANSITWTAQIRRDIQYWPDPLVYTRSSYGSQVFTGAGNCQGNGGYYSQIHFSNGVGIGSATSSRIC